MQKFAQLPIKLRFTILQENNVFDSTFGFREGKSLHVQTITAPRNILRGQLKID